MPYCVMTSVLLRLTSRPTYWRIAVILPGRILWRTYSRVEYPTPDDAVRRCLAGLCGRQDHSQHKRQDRAKYHPKPVVSHADAAAEDQGESNRSEGQVHDSALHYDPSNRYHRSHCGYPDNDSFHDLLLSGCIQPQTDQRPEECRHGHSEPQHRLPAIEGDEATQHRRPLPSVRAAWWGWL